MVYPIQNGQIHLQMTCNFRIVLGSVFIIMFPKFCPYMGMLHSFSSCIFPMRNFERIDFCKFADEDNFVRNNFCENFSSYKFLAQISRIQVHFTYHHKIKFPHFSNQINFGWRYINRFSPLFKGGLKWTKGDAFAGIIDQTVQHVKATYKHKGCNSSF